jgi:hypothetical protein
LNSEATLANAELKMKSNPSTRCLLSGAPTHYFRAVRNKNRDAMSGADQRKSKELLRDATSEGQSSNQEDSNQKTNQDKESTRK